MAHGAHDLGGLHRDAEGLFFLGGHYGTLILGNMLKHLPSGEHTKSNGKWPFIVDFPMKNGDFPWQNVSSPEGTLEVGAGEINSSG